MKITLHKKIVAFFGYEFTRITQNIFQDQKLHIFELIKRKNIDLVLDVGANMGQFATDLRKSGYTGQIISFEPIAQCYQHLISIADSKWQIENYALGDKSSEELINISNKSVFSSLLDTNDFGKAKFSESIKIIDKQLIQIKKLDDVIPNIITNIESKKIFLKLDTQGYDTKVLAGAINTLNYVSALQTEISCKAIYENTQPHFETLKYLAGSGFNITGIYPLSHDDQTMELLEFDCVMTKAIQTE